MSHPVAGATERVPVAVSPSEGFAAVSAALSGEPLPAAIYQDGSLTAAALALAEGGKPPVRVVAVLAKAAEMPHDMTVYDKIQKDGNNITVVDLRGDKIGKPTNAFDHVGYPHEHHIRDGLIHVDPEKGINGCEDCHSNLPLSALVVKDGKVVGVTVDKVELKLPAVRQGIPVDMAYTLVQAALNDQCDKCHKEVMGLAKKAGKGDTAALGKLEAWVGKGFDLARISAPVTKKEAQECRSCHPDATDGSDIVKGREGIK